MIPQLQLHTLRGIKSAMLSRGERPVAVVERPVVSALNLDDLKGTFMLLGIFVAAATVAAAAEGKGKVKLGRG